MTTLENSYCRPKTEEEWKVLTMVKTHPKDTIVFKWGGEIISASDSFALNRTEIPVKQFIDLLHDRITPWRLEEVGFVRGETSLNYTIRINSFLIVIHRIAIDESVIIEGVTVDCSLTSITTFTDLLTLIRFLTP